MVRSVLRAANSHNPVSILESASLIPGVIATTACNVPDYSSGRIVRNQLPNLISSQVTRNSLLGHKNP